MSVTSQASINIRLAVAGTITGMFTILVARKTGIPKSATVSSTPVVATVSARKKSMLGALKSNTTFFTICCTAVGVTDVTPKGRTTALQTTAATVSPVVVLASGMKLVVETLLIVCLRIRMVSFVAESTFRSMLATWEATYEARSFS